MADPATFPPSNSVLGELIPLWAQLVYPVMETKHDIITSPISSLSKFWTWISSFEFEMINKYLTSQQQQLHIDRWTGFLGSLASRGRCCPITSPLTHTQGPTQALYPALHFMLQGLGAPESWRTGLTPVYRLRDQKNNNWKIQIKKRTNPRHRPNWI